MKDVRTRGLAAAMLLLATAWVADAATLSVESNGTDSPTCGIAAPCRSIGRAVAHALPNDRIVVGPGSYGSDLDQDGVMNEPGEEPLSGAGGIIVDQPLEIVSRLGASSTVLRTSAIGFDVRSSNVTIGRRNHGFTLASTSLPFAVAGAGLLDGVRIAGNVLALDGPDAPAGILAIGTRGARFEDNRIDAPRGCGVGIYLQDSGGVVANNAIFGCSKGVQVELGVSMRLVHNTVAGNVRSGAAGKGAGFDLQGDIAEVSGNVVLGNGTGVIVRTTPIASFRNNAFIASITNCGVQNLSDGTLVAAGNYWGAASGPGADPADAACGIAAATSVVTTPFLGSDPTQAQVALR